MLRFKIFNIISSQKAPEFSTDPFLCQGIKKGQQIALDKFVSGASPEMVSAGIVTAAELVCKKSFKSRFGEVLEDTCLNIVAC